MLLSSALANDSVEFIEEPTGIVVRYLRPRCRICGLSERFPDADLNLEEVCKECVNFQTDKAQQNVFWRDRIKSILESSFGGSRYDCVVLFSGGKDSSLALLKLRREFDLKVLACTLDNGFLSDIAYQNVGRIVDALEVDHIFIKPNKRLITELYRTSLTEPFDDQTVRYSTSACGSCISIVLALGAEEARMRGAPLMAGGWTPGQLTHEPIVSGLFLEDICLRHFGPLRLSSPALANSLERYLPTRGSFPPLFNPLYCQQYKEAEALETLADFGWQRPNDTDSCSTNCRLNGFLVLDHIAKYGYHPYEYELTHHVRTGQMSRADAIDKFSRLRVSRAALDLISSALDQKLPPIVAPFQTRVR